MKTMIRLLNEESGATAIEYGLIAALISVAAIGTMTALGGQLSQLFGTIQGDIANAGGAAAAR